MRSEEHFNRRCEKALDPFEQRVESVVNPPQPASSVTDVVHGVFRAGLVDIDDGAYHSALRTALVQLHVARVLRWMAERDVPTDTPVAMDFIRQHAVGTISNYFDEIDPLGLRDSGDAAEQSVEVDQALDLVGQHVPPTTYFEHRAVAAAVTSLLDRWEDPKVRKLLAAHAKDLMPARDALTWMDESDAEVDRTAAQRMASIMPIVVGTHRMIDDLRELDLWPSDRGAGGLVSAYLKGDGINIRPRRFADFLSHAIEPFMLHAVERIRSRRRVLTSVRFDKDRLARHVASRLVTYYLRKRRSVTAKDAQWLRETAREIALRVAAGFNIVKAKNLASGGYYKARLLFWIAQDILRWKGCTPKLLSRVRKGIVESSWPNMTARIRNQGTPEERAQLRELQSGG